MNNSLEKLQSHVRICTKCSLCDSRQNAVPGKGNPNAKIVFVGEAPGRSEDKLGEPFIGAAGKKLTEALENAGISRESVYITNVVKCRPPNNRVPTETEKMACSEYLNAEIAIIKPKIICIMGNTAYRSLLNGSNITKNRGKIITKGGKRYFVTIHPAATIYNKDFQESLNEDMLKLSSLVSEI